MPIMPDDDNEDLTTSPDSDSTPVSGSPSAAPMPSSSPVAAAILQRIAANQAALKAAQTKSLQNKGLATLAEGAGQMVAGLARTGDEGFKPSSYQSLQDLANLPVQNLQQQQQAMGQGLQQGLAQQAIENNAEAQDPNSPRAKMLQAIASKVSPALAGTQFAPQDFGNVTKILDTEENAKSRRQQYQLMADYRNQMKQAQNFMSTSQLLESARGNPAAQQAEKDVYASNKLDTLVHSMGDPNNASGPQVMLAASEVGKIAMGGVPQEYELRGLNPSTVPKGLAALAQSVIGHPTPANMGAFIKQFKDYADAVRKDAQQVITDRYGRIIEARRGLLSPDQYSALKSEYLDRFNSPPPPQPANSPAGNIPGSGVDPALEAEMRKRKLIK